MEELLPESVVTVEAHGNDGVEGATLFPEEQALITRAVEKRRREFTAVRACARLAMEKLGVAPQPVLPGERGAPQWPSGLAGSMTHCEGYCAASLVRVTDLASLGIDAEPHAGLPDGVLASVALGAETARLRRLAADAPAVHWDRLLFSAKESVYKAWFPLTGKWLDFSEADIELFPDSRVAVDREAVPGPDSAAAPHPEAQGAPAPSGRLHAELLVAGPLVGGRRIASFDGRWTVQRGLVATAVTVPHL